MFLDANDKVAAKGVGESGDVLEGFSLVCVGISVKIALVIDSKTLRNLPHEKLLEVVLCDSVEVETINCHECPPELASAT
jgi:hypothetical protein